MEVTETLQKLGYSQLNPMQEKALEAGLLTERHFLACCPTASGKTLLALLRIAANKGKGKCVYIVPLRALASEKHKEFSASLSPFEMSVGVSTGDFDSSNEELASYDVIVVTSEKMESLLRHKASWLKTVSLAIADEIHLINDEGRGPTLEIVLTKLKETGSAVVGLSATIPNNKEVAQWLQAKLFESNYRPTVLEKKVACEGKLFSEEGAEKLEEKEMIDCLAKKALCENKGKGQAIVFVSTRRSTEALAKQLCRVVSAVLTEEEKKECELLSQKALKALPQATSQCFALSNCLKNGVAFHHAGLVEKDRQLIEKGFKEERCVKAIVATTTLAMGIDFPASWVIVRDVKRFSGDFSVYLPNLEVQQMLGRAGRPRFDKRGVGVVVASRRDLITVRDKYILGPLENIYSKLSSEPALRMHTLSLVASDYCSSFEELQSFFSKTFFAQQYGATQEFFALIEKIALQLSKWDFLREKNGRLVATPVGKRVSELYIDPLTANNFVEFIKKRSAKIVNATATKTLLAPSFALLLEFSGAIESKPLPRVGRHEEQSLWEEAFGALEGDALERFEFDRNAVEKWKNAKIAQAWVDEEGEKNIMEKFDLPPGVLHSRMRVLQWLSYSLGEIAFLMNAAGVRSEARKLERRIKHGVKEELLDLVRLRGIGRVRARKLFGAGITNRIELHAAEKEKVKALLGEKVAEKVLELP